MSDLPIDLKVVLIACKNPFQLAGIHPNCISFTLVTCRLLELPELPNYVSPHSSLTPQLPFLGSQVDRCRHLLQRRLVAFITVFSVPPLFFN